MATGLQLAVAGGLGGLLAYQALGAYNAAGLVGAQRSALPFDSPQAAILQATEAAATRSAALYAAGSAVVLAATLYAWSRGS